MMPNLATLDLSELSRGNYQLVVRSEQGVSQSIYRYPIIDEQNVCLSLHGGSGTILKGHLSNEQERAYRETLRQALQRGTDLLVDGSSALDCVEAVVLLLRG